MFNYLIIFLSFLSFSWASVHEKESIESLSQDPHWLKLLHYRERIIGKAKSDITSTDYFLSADGHTNPKKELIATIKGLKDSEEIYCRFVSRRLWLEKKGWTFPLRECPEYDEWTRGNSVKSISLIFASGFLGNPASYFGHPLLKFNFKDKRSPLNLLDTAINYGAFTPPDVNGFEYAIYGIFGGYDAGFTSADFFFHRNNYSELELRDLWEYELALTKEQVDELVAHVWDLKNAKLKYYFFDDNCAYRMSELLELVVDDELMPKRTPYAIPATLFHHLHEYGLVQNIKLLSSRQTRLIEKVRSLSQKERSQLELMISNSEQLHSNEFKSLTENERKRVLEVGLDYYSYRAVLDDDEKLKAAKRKILQERVILSTGQSKWKQIPLRPPHQAQKPVLTQLGYFQSEKFGQFGSFRFRPAFYDIVSPDAARPELSSLSIFDLELNFKRDRLWLRSFNLISVESLNVSRTGLPGDGGYAWRFKLGADQLNLACNTCTVARLEGGIGKAWIISKSFVFYIMLDPRLQTQYKGSGHISINPNISALITFSDAFRVNAAVGRRFYIDSDHSAENIYLVEGRLGSSRTWDIRLSFQEHIDRRYGLGVGLYW